MEIASFFHVEFVADSLMILERGHNFSEMANGLRS